LAPALEGAHGPHGGLWGRSLTLTPRALPRESPSECNRAWSLLTVPARKRYLTRCSQPPFTLRCACRALALRSLGATRARAHARAHACACAHAHAQRPVLASRKASRCKRVAVDSPMRRGAAAPACGRCLREARASDLLIEGSARRSRGAALVGRQIPGVGPATTRVRNIAAGVLTLPSE